ncbi:hypothetical protein [Hydrogenophaga crocea]|uniref:Lipoprotein n=1 Tax=Hydrogenophaga crocea TaxID=2716225 RepID=A0A6G8IC22_9BURK|nr:hypothetical protein [Hydrogenophaga crocea]QIM50679.1 hypothetical protein G9Q37_00290 [Hydrogenophaga crocea]
MRHIPLKPALGLVLAGALLSGCGGGGGDAPPAAPQAQAAMPFMGNSVQSLLQYMNRLIAQTSETSTPEPVDNQPLPVDDTV